MQPSIWINDDWLGVNRLIQHRHLYKAKKKNWKMLPKDEWWTQGYLFDNGYSGSEQKYFVGYLVIDEYRGTACDEWDINGIAFYEVDPDTICQCVGLKDRNGKVVFEHDILNGFLYPYCYDGKHNYYAQMAWSDYTRAFVMIAIKNLESSVCGISDGNTELVEEWNSEVWEIIGNTFDNPELLGE